MIRNNAYYELFASYTVPNPDQVGYWIDLGANSKGKIVKVYNENLRQWVKVLDASSEDAVSPFIGSNGNWWVDNRDTGIPAAGKNPYIGENGNWYVYDPLSKKFVDTGIIAKGRSAYEIAVEHGFQGTEDEWLESLKQPALDAAQVALEAAERANEEVEKLQGIYQQVTDALDLVAEATENANTAAQSANDAADRSNLIASNPPKIVNETWYMFDEETNEYVSTGIKAIGDAFTIIKTYTSVEEMQADYSNPEVGIGQFVMIDTGDVDNPEDSQLYLKGETEWKFISDLSGAQGIQGLSAYQVAVQEGFVGSEEEWVESLSKDSKEAAQLALQAKEQVEQTEQAVKNAEALRVTAESERVAAENIREENEASRIAKEAERVSAEQARVDAENNRVEAENTRAANEAARVEAENARVTAENQRVSAESSRVEAEQARVTAESGRVTAEENRESAEETRKQNEEARVSAESSRVTAEQQRVTQEKQRQKNIQTAIKNTETAIENTNVAIANAEAATENANTQADRAKEFSDNPPKIQDNFWYIWDEATDTYVNTNVQAKGEKGDQGLPGESYTLPIASSTTLGGIKVGAGLQINAETGVLNTTGGGTADAVDWDNITSKPDFSAVATSGDYNDLINTPNIPDVSNLATKDEVALKANSSDVYTKSETYTKTETDNAIKQASATVFKYKGTVDSFDFLPTLNVSIGDVYTLADTNEEYVATTSSPDPVWEYLGVKVDLSDYSTTAENDAKYQPKGDYITEDNLTWDIIDGKPTTLAGYGIAASDVLTTIKGVDGSGSGLDADLLDGKDSLLFFQKYGSCNNIDLDTLTDNGAWHFNITGGKRPTNAPEGACGYGNLVVFRSDSEYTQLYISDRGYGIYERSKFSSNNWGSWKKLAYTTDNVASASKLATSRYIWGQPFNGERNVTGNLTGVGNIYMTEAIRFTNNDFNIIDHNLGVNILSKQSGGLYIQDGSGGNVIIGVRGTNNIEFWGGQTSSVSSGSKLGEWTTAGLCIGGASHDAKLHVVGKGLFTGGNLTVKSTTTESKAIINVGNLELYQSTPYIDFHYNNSDKDYTSRIIEEAEGKLNINNVIFAYYTDKVGVGTSSPEAKLHVVGDGKFTGNVTAPKFIGTSTNTEGALGGDITFKRLSKKDNSGYPVYCLISDCTEGYTAESGKASYQYGFMGFAISNRNAGYGIKGFHIISANFAFSTNYITLSVAELPNNYGLTDNITHRSTIEPCIVKYNDKYYVALKLNTASFDLYLCGKWSNPLSSFIYLKASRPTSLPEGLTVLHTSETLSQLTDKKYPSFLGQFTINGQKVAYIPSLITESSTSTSTYKLDPDTFYKFSNIENLNITLNATDPIYMHEYMFEFTTGSSATTLNLPDDVKWMGGSAPTIKTNKTYQVSIVNNLAVIGEF